MLLVSMFDHCLVDLLYRRRIGELPMDIVGHRLQPPARDLCAYRSRRIPFHYLPVTSRPSRSRRQQIWDADRGDADRARRARALHAGAVGRVRAKLSGRCINIHHSFLPGFKGAKPYHQAHERGVKMIGATAHYVTSRPRRRPDHRPGRRAHLPSRHARRPRAQGPRHRAPGAGARAVRPPRGPGDPQRTQDRGVLGLRLSGG